MPQVDLKDTIVALATPPGEGGIAVVRVSGRDALSFVGPFFHSSNGQSLNAQKTHTIQHGFFLDEKNQTVDEILVSVFRSPHSFTGEDVVEINCHGGIRLTKRIIEILVRSGVRPAEPGEFTKRAFLNGKMDLTQAEAVLDLVRAKSEISLKAALCQLEGNLSKKIHSLKEKLLEVTAHLEAGLDFPDERLDVYSREECFEKIEKIENEIQSLVGSFKRGLVMREGVLGVIVGRPNVGKSSLLNSLLARDRALVSPIPGTTRDSLEEALEIGGFSLRLVDTAGLSLGPKDELDRMGMARTRSFFQEAGLFLFVVDGSSAWTAEDGAILKELEKKNFLIIINKSDLHQKLDKGFFKQVPNERLCLISCVTGRGIPDLEKQIEANLIQSGVMIESLTLTRLRHKLALEKALETIARSKKTLDQKESPEFVLVDLKTALDSLRELVGEIYSEDLLDVIFQEFCIGK